MTERGRTSTRSAGSSKRLLLLMSVSFLSGCCTSSTPSEPKRVPLPLNRVTRPTREELQEDRPVDWLGRLIRAHNYIDSLERDGPWLFPEQED